MLRLRQDKILFPQGRQKAFTLSSDDGVTQDGPLASLMRKYGIKGTFHINTGLAGDRDWLIQPGIDASHYKYSMDEIREVYQGFELAVHTMTHPDLTKVPTSFISYEIAENKKELEDIVHHPVQGMSYPFGTYNDTVKRIASDCGILYSRTVKETRDFSLPDDFLEWNPTCHYCGKNREELAEKFLAPLPKNTSYSPRLFYVWGHAYQLDAYNDWDNMEKFFQMISGREDVWYASNIEICTYLLAARNLVYSSQGDYIFNPSCLDVWLLIDHQVYRIGSGETITVNWQHHDD